MVAQDTEEEKNREKAREKKSNRIRFLPLYDHSSSSSSRGCQLLWEDVSWRLSLSPGQPLSCQPVNVAKAHAWGLQPLARALQLGSRERKPLCACVCAC